MRRIEEANKFELVLSINALVARALADEVIESGRFWHLADMSARYEKRAQQTPTNDPMIQQQDRAEEEEDFLNTLD